MAQLFYSICYKTIVDNWVFKLKKKIGIKRETELYILVYHYILVI